MIALALHCSAIRTDSSNKMARQKLSFQLNGALCLNTNATLFKYLNISDGIEWLTNFDENPGDWKKTSKMELGILITFTMLLNNALYFKCFFPLIDYFCRYILCALLPLITNIQSIPFHSIQFGWTRARRSVGLDLFCLVSLLFSTSYFIA